MRDPAGRPPPHDDSAEAILLSSILSKPDRLDAVLHILGAEDFHNAAHRTIFGAFVALRQAGDPLEFHRVRSYLTDHDLLAKAGGSYLSELELSTPVSVHVERHAARIAELADCRRVIEAAHRIAAEGYGDVGDRRAWIQSAEQSIYDAANRRADDSTVSFRESLEGVFRAVQDAESGKGDLGVATGLRDLDAMLGGLRAGEVTVLGAHSGIGKSALATCIATNAAAAGHGVLVFSLEMRHQELTQRILFAEARVDSSKIKRRERMTDGDWRALTEVASLRGNMPVWIDDRSELEPIQLRAKVRRVQALAKRRECKLGLVILDYLQLVNGRALTTKNSNREQEVSAVSRSLKVLAKEAQLPVVVLAQLNADNDKRKGDAKPRLGDLRESKGIAQNADNVVLVYNPNALERAKAYRDGDRTRGPLPAEAVDLIVAKQRAGLTGTVRALYWPSYTLFTDWDDNTNTAAIA